MKYLVFLIVTLGMPPLAIFLSHMPRWFRYVFIGIFAAMCMYQTTAINFYSYENYRGSARGIEISFIHLLAFVLIGGLYLCGKFKRWVPDWGAVLYLVYCLLCLPSLTNVANGLYASFELWKMVLLFVFYVAVYNYLEASGDIRPLIGGLAAFAVINMGKVAFLHFSGIYQPHGVFPHRNSMAMCMNLCGPLFLAYYLTHGLKGWWGKWMALACVCAGVAILRSYSRFAIAMMPIGHGMAAFCCLSNGSRLRWARRIMPVFLSGGIVLGVLAPRILERFQNAPESSTRTRIELALCAWEMIKEEPWRGVGLNNWGVKINPPYEYAERAERQTNREVDYQDGIVESVYLLVAAECGIPALVAMLAWVGWYWVACIGMMRRLRGTRWFFIPAGLFGGMAVFHVQGCMEWVFRQQLNIICFMALLALLSWLHRNQRRLARMSRTA